MEYWETKSVHENMTRGETLVVGHGSMDGGIMGESSLETWECSSPTTWFFIEHDFS